MRKNKYLPPPRKEGKKYCIFNQPLANKLMAVQTILILFSKQQISHQATPSGGGETCPAQLRGDE